MPAPDTLVMPLAQILLTCYADALAEQDDPPASTMLRPGEIVTPFISTATDECCEGLAWVRIATMYPSEIFPEIDGTVRKPGISPNRYAVVFELGAVRCAPTPEQHEIPTADQWEHVVQQTMDDAAAMRRAVCCFLKPDAPEQPRLGLVGPWEPWPVEGRCAGGTMTLTVGQIPCGCA